MKYSMRVVSKRLFFVVKGYRNGSCTSIATNRFHSRNLSTHPASHGGTVQQKEGIVQPDGGNAHRHVHAVASFDLEKARQEILQTWIWEEGRSPNGSQIRARYCCFTYDDAVRAYNDRAARWHWLDREMSSNVAGETGAVHVYKGALAAHQYVRPLPPSAVEFCMEHQQTEAGHLSIFTSLVPSHKHTKLLPLWRLAGWFVGFLPTALAGSRGLYVTVEAIESFVEEHFQEQIQPLENHPKHGSNETIKTPHLLEILKYCCEDEVHHKDEAASKLIEGDFDYSKVWWASPWKKVVHWGSAIAADIARKI